MESDSSRLVLYLFLLIASLGVFVFFRFASIVITRSQSAKIEKLAENKFPFFALARSIIQKIDAYLFTAQAGSLLSGLTCGALCVFVFLNLKVSSSDDLLVKLAALILLILVVTSMALFFVQIGKAFLHQQTEKVLCIASPLLVSLHFLLKPFQTVLDHWVRLLFIRLGFEIPYERELAVSAEEISRIVALSTEAGEIEEDEQELLQGVFEFSDTVTREVMTPRSDIVFVNTESSLTEVVDTFLESGHSRLIVIGEELDDVKGILLAKDLTGMVGKKNGTFDITKIMRPAHFVSGSKKIDDLLQELRIEAVHLAVVLDEHGGIDGLVTMEDLIEEIVGEIFDEFDRPADETEVKAMKSGELLVDGSMSLDDLNSLHGFEFEEGEYDTIAGFVIHKLGRIPDEGEIAEIAGVLIKIEQVVQNRIVLLRISPPSDSSKLEVA